MLTLHFVAHLIKTPPLNTGLEASCPVNSRLQEYPKSKSKPKSRGTHFQNLTNFVRLLDLTLTLTLTSLKY